MLPVQVSKGISQPGQAYKMGILEKIDKSDSTNLSTKKTLFGTF